MTRIRFFARGHSVGLLLTPSSQHLALAIRYLHALGLKQIG